MLADFIELSLYFRICHVVADTLYEDLLFLQKNIFKADLDYNENVQGLFTSGLMYLSVIGEETKYSFNSFARDVDRYSISYDNLGRYPSPQPKKAESNILPKTQISQPEEPPFTEEDIKDIFKD